jgi:hypothetical protein
MLQTDSMSRAPRGWPKKQVHVKFSGSGCSFGLPTVCGARRVAGGGRWRGGRAGGERAGAVALLEADEHAGEALRANVAGGRIHAVPSSSRHAKAHWRFTPKAKVNAWAVPE